MVVAVIHHRPWHSHILHTLHLVHGHVLRIVTAEIVKPGVLVPVTTMRVHAVVHIVIRNIPWRSVRV